MILHWIFKKINKLPLLYVPYFGILSSLLIVRIFT